MRYTKDIFDILSKGGFVSQNSMQRALLYDDIEDNFQEYQEYYEKIGFLLEGGNGYYYFSRTESKVELTDKVQRMKEPCRFPQNFQSYFWFGVYFSQIQYPREVF